VGVVALVGGAGGAVLGAVVGVAVWVVVGRLEPAGARRQREALERQAPLTIDLVAACLASGATLEASAAAAADAVGSPTSDLLEAAVAAQRLGAPAADAWSAVARHDALAPLARAVVRAHDSGAPVSDVLARAAARARARHRARVEARVRTAAVRLTGPLGLAFLPAFVLLGVVPVVASWIGSVL
jgi:Flp pilus assembly protein TadB